MVVVVVADLLWLVAQGKRVRSRRCDGDVLACIKWINRKTIGLKNARQWWIALCSRDHVSLASTPIAGHASRDTWQRRVAVLTSHARPIKTFQAFPVLWDCVHGVLQELKRGFIGKTKEWMWLVAEISFISKFVLIRAWLYARNWVLFKGATLNYKNRFRTSVKCTVNNGQTLRVRAYVWPRLALIDNWKIFTLGK